MPKKHFFKDIPKRKLNEGKEKKITFWVIPTNVVQKLCIEDY